MGEGDNIPRKHTIEDLRLIYLKKGHKLLSENYTGVRTKLKSVDLDSGYFIYSTVSEIQSKYIPKPFSKSNPFTMDNIKRFLTVNKANFKVVGGHYKDSKIPSILFKCNKEECEYEWIASWASIRMGNGCPKCGGSLRLTNKDFVERSTKAHNGFYDYSKVNYVNSTTKVIIICPEHGEFEQLPGGHMNGKTGCIDCKNKKISISNSDSVESFIEKAKLVHGDKYIYENVNYTNAKDKVGILCKTHGLYYQTPDSHLSGAGCPSCSKNKVLTTKEVVERCISTHGDTYSYSQVVYKNKATKIKIICKIHGVFEMLSDNHIRLGQNCPKCSKSRGENFISLFMSTYNIKFSEQVKFEDLRGVNGGMLSYDFYIEDQKLLIEFQGKQHETPIEHFGGVEQFEVQKKHDKAKRDYAKKNGYELLEIWYYDYNVIEEILKQKLLVEHMDRR